jgi:hypothetical protein
VPSACGATSGSSSARTTTLPGTGRADDRPALRPGERAAGIGACWGYFMRRVARILGPARIAPEVLAYLEERARRDGLDSVRIQRSRANDPEVPPSGVDTSLMVCTLHSVKGRAACARKPRDGLAPGAGW